MKLIIITLFIFFCFNSLNTKATTTRIPGYKSKAELSDSTQFLPNETQGWSSLSTYLVVESDSLNSTEDSVDLELILSYVPPINDDLSYPALAGVIDNTFVPGEERIIEYKEPTRTWSLTVNPTGELYLKLIDGPAPVGSPYIIPIQIKYKK